jgi:hypothetical protein
LDRAELLARRPDLAAELCSLIADHGRIRRLATPLRPPAEATSSISVPSRSRNTARFAPDDTQHFSPKM